MKLLRLFFLLILLTAALASFLARAPYGPHSPTFVDIPSGTTTSGMATRLKAAGIIRSTVAFEALRLIKPARLKAGEYLFDHPAPLTDIYARIAKGDVYTIQVTLPEGYNIFDIAQTIQGAGLADAQTFLAAEQKDTALIRDLSPHAASLEGYLFPDTYRFSRHTTPDQMLAAMVKRFRAVAVQLGLIASNGFIGDRIAYDVPHIVTMASLIEKEVRVDKERPLVAGVFVNRLAQNMPLATDPTVIYAALLAGRWRGTIYQSDLAYDSPYNTYRHPGMPPGPIANPGVAALKAALHPAHTDYLYFVADAQGHSIFSRTLKDHNAAVAAYRQAQKPTHTE